MFAVLLLALVSGCTGVSEGPRNASTPLAVDPALLTRGDNPSHKP